MKSEIILICVILCALFTFLEEGLAQLPPEKSLPEVQQEKLMEEPPEEKVPEPPKAEIEEKLPPEAPPAPEEAVKFLVTKIIVEGSTVFTQEELREITAPCENKELTLTELNAVADKITQLYQNAGYITSRAYLPPQKIKEGVIIIRIFEGKVGQTNIEGNRYFKSSLITSRFERLKGKILKQGELRSALLYLNRNPDLEVRATLMPGEEPQYTDILLVVKDRFPHHLGYAFNNLGTRLTKRYRHILSYISYNFLGFNDTLSLQFPWAEYGMVQSGSAQYIRPLNDLGTQLGLTASYTKVKIGKEYIWSDVRGASQSYSGYIQHPLFETNQLSGTGQIGFEILNSFTESMEDKIILNKLRVLNLGFVFNEQDLHGRTNVSGDIDMGFSGFLGSSEEKDRLLSPRSSTSRFTRFKYGITRLHMLPLSSYIILSGTAQITPDKLTNPKRFLLGGAYSVRGYPESDISGDYGFNTNTEVRTPCFIIPSGLSFKGRKIRDMLQLAFFSDMGAVFNRGIDEDSFLAGGGLGLRLTVDRYVTGRVDVAWPVGDHPAEEKEDDFQVHFSLSARY